MAGARGLAAPSRPAPHLRSRVEPPTAPSSCEDQPKGIKVPVEGHWSRVKVSAPGLGTGGRNAPWRGALLTTQWGRPSRKTRLVTEMGNIQGFLGRKGVQTGVGVNPGGPTCMQGPGGRRPCLGRLRGVQAAQVQRGKDFVPQVVGRGPGPVCSQLWGWCRLELQDQLGGDRAGSDGDRLQGVGTRGHGRGCGSQGQLRPSLGFITPGGGRETGWGQGLLTVLAPSRPAAG